ncbi:hypothetical protein JCM19029_19680 [Salinicoccus sesuvii]
MFILMDEEKRRRVIKARNELKKVLDELEEQHGRNALSDDFIPVNSAIKYLDNAIYYENKHY